MSSHIPQDPLFVSPSHTVVPPTSEDTASTSPSVFLDSVAKASSREATAPLQGENTVPRLTTPSPEGISITESLRNYLAATREYRDTLAASNQADLAIRGQYSQLAREQVNALLELFRKKEEILKNLSQSVQSRMDEMQKRLDELQNQPTGEDVGTAYMIKVIEYNAAVDQFVRDNHLEGLVSIPHISLPKPSKEALSFDYQTLAKVMNENAYAAQIAPLDQEITTLTIFWPFLKEIIDSLKRIEASPNSPSQLKSLEENLVSYLSEQAESLPLGVLVMQAIGLTSPHLRACIGHRLFEEAMKEVEMAKEEANQKEKEQPAALPTVPVELLTEKALEPLVFPIELLSVALLSSQAIPSVIPSFASITEVMPTLSGKSPVIPLLFGVSFANRVLENQVGGITEKAVATFLETRPEFKILSPLQKKKIKASLELGHLVVAGKLIENALGLQGALLPYLLPDLSPLERKTMTIEAKTAEREFKKERVAQIQQVFETAGFPEETAKFLAEVKEELGETATLAYPLTKNLSKETLNVPLLERSLQTALILRNIPLEKAVVMASQAVEKTLAEGPFPSPKQLQETLAFYLSDLKVKDEAHIAASIPLFPPVLLPPDLTSLTTPQEISTVIQTHVVQLFAPQLGMALAQNVGQALLQTLFGTPNPDAKTMAEIKSPYAFVNVAEHKVRDLGVREDKQFATALHETFRESIKSMTDFHTFSLKLMDPAYAFIRLSAPSIYGTGTHGGYFPV